MKTHPMPDHHEWPTSNREIYSVSRRNFDARDLLETEFPTVWGEGEISNLARPASGHIYFSIKDERCQIRAAMFKGRNRHLDFEPENGTQVLVRARVSLYPNRGDFQLIVESMEESGEGALRRAFQALKRRLDAEGLFAPEAKLPIPALPARIGVVTSPSGAAVRDILSVLGRRFPSIPVIVYPVPVQGEGAGQRIAEMLEVANERNECDVLLLSRGGGSLEDLWAFNEEVVARAIASSQIPVVTGVGHEIDFTIADFVADQRAATPSAAAELVTPDKTQWQKQLRGLVSQLDTLMRNELRQHREQTLWLKRRLIHPQRYLQDLSQRADDAALRLRRACEWQLRTRQSALKSVVTDLQAHKPGKRLAMMCQLHEQLGQRLSRAINSRIVNKRAQFAQLARTFDAVSPQRTLDRGYAIITLKESGDVVRSPAQTPPGTAVRARLADGSVGAIVKS